MTATPTCDGDGSHPLVHTVNTHRTFFWKSGTTTICECPRCGRRKYVDSEE